MNKKQCTNFSLTELPEEEVMSQMVLNYLTRKVFDGFEVELREGRAKITEVTDDEFTVLLLSPQGKHLFYVTVKYPVERWNGENKQQILCSPKITDIHEARIAPGETAQQYYDKRINFYKK